MRYAGVNYGGHDAGISFISEEGNILFAAAAERYSKQKNYPELTDSMWNMIEKDDHVSFYEDPYLRYEWFTKIRAKIIKPHDLKLYSSIMKPEFILSGIDDYCMHHVSHVAGGFFTRPWESTDDIVMLSIDGHGELESACIYDNNFNNLLSVKWPTSIGGVYGETTRVMGLKLLEDEYVVMGLSSYGEPNNDIVNHIEEFYNKTNPAETDLKGCIKHCYHTIAQNNKEMMAASVQKWAEDKIYELASEARKYGSKLIYSGGVAQNIIANTKIKDLFDDVWIPPSCSDSGSSLGAAALSWSKATGKNKLNWKDAYLGYEIEREVNPREVVDHILANRYCGIANGRAEFGPRALGNRSLIADVRYDVKDTVNGIKRRQKYRPFAPAILEEFADQYFEGHMNEYMQYTAKALHDYSSVTHVDGTARVQIVPKDSSSIFRKVIEEYYERTGVPMLLNTSLNIRGMPIVNDERDAIAFERQYGVKVF